MSLGGYKFAGKYCERGNLTDQQWALRMHKTKVAAFMAANAIADAGWDYDMTGSPDGNYHCLDSVGNNYVTVFKRTNETDDYTWFAIYTLPFFTTTGTPSGYAIVTQVSDYFNGSILWYLGNNASSFVSISNTGIGYNDRPGYINALLPIGNLGHATTATNANGGLNSLFTATENYYGFAVKGDRVIAIQGKEPSSQYLTVSIFAGHAYSSFVDESDSNGLLFYNLQNINNTVSNDYEVNARVGRSQSEKLTSPVFLIKQGTSGTVLGMLSCAPLAHWNTTISNYPFQALSSFSQNAIGGSPVSGKGTIDVDFLAVNFTGNSQGLYPQNLGTYANGNYLAVRRGGWNNSDYQYGISISGFNSLYSWYYDVGLYVGWDPSNPDITQASSWSLYDGT